MTNQFSDDKRFNDAVRGYEKYESMCELKRVDAESIRFADKVFYDTMSTMNEIASDYGVSFDDVLAAVRKVSRF